MVESNKVPEFDRTGKKLRVSDVEECCDKPQIEISYENNSNADGSGILGVTLIVFKCKNCGKPKWL